MIATITAEETARAFLEAWQRRDWEAMERVVQVSRRDRGGVTAETLAATFGTKRLERFVIGVTRPHSDAAFFDRPNEDGTTTKLWISPEAVAVWASIDYRIARRRFGRKVAILVAREGPDGYPRPADEPAEWGVNDLSMLRERPR